MECVRDKTGHMGKPDNGQVAGSCPPGAAVPPLQEHGFLLSTNTTKDITNTSGINREVSPCRIAYQPGDAKRDGQFTHTGNICGCRNT